MKNLIRASALFVITVTAIGSAQANVVWFENWNPSDFALKGQVTDHPVGNLTDRAGWLNVSYNVIGSTLPAQENGWTFSGSTFLVINTTAASPSEGSGALYLNECCNAGVTGSGGGVASSLITGLTAGQAYQLSFTYWGDNRPADGGAKYLSYPGYYDLFVTIGDNPQATFEGSDQYPGTGTGYDVNMTFVATGSSELLSLAQYSSGHSEQSPIVGAMTVSTFTPQVIAASAPEPASWALVLLGFAGLGFAGFRKKARGARIEAALE